MKAAELRRHAKCSICTHLVGEAGLPLFWKVTVERYGVDLTAVRRHDGFTAFIGNAAIAGVMGDNPDVAKRLGEPIELTVCESCGTGDPRAGLIVSALIEMESRG